MGEVYIVVMVFDTMGNHGCAIGISSTTKIHSWRSRVQSHSQTKLDGLGTRLGNIVKNKFPATSVMLTPHMQLVSTCKCRPLSLHEI